jgi:hypothetical protein
VSDDDEDEDEPEQAQHDDAAPEPEQAELFPQLQRRYPSSRAGEYILREQMTAADLSFNVGRLRKEGSAKSKHADALEAWWEIRNASEPLSPAA